MNFLKLFTKDPYYNLAVEEYLFSNSKEEVFILWQNEPTVVIGKNQNAYCEIDPEYLARQNIKLSRRITGGGAVYHDLGNLNYTFIASAREDGIDFPYFTRPIVAALNSLGLDASLTGRNDIVASGYKVSGNAQCNRGGRVLHHGTLLFDSDLDVLSNVLRVDEEKLKSKALKSTRSRVKNIKELITRDMSVSEFADYITEFICNEFSPIMISPPENSEIQALYERNKSDEWLYPESDLLSRWDYTTKRRFPIGSVTVSLCLKNGIITKGSFGGDFFALDDISPLNDALIGKNISNLRDGTVKLPEISLISGFTEEMLFELLK